MATLRNLSILKSSNSSSETTTGAKEEKPFYSYHNQGVGASRACQGHYHNLKTNLEALFHRFENDCKLGEIEQHKLKLPFISELKGKNTVLLNKTEELGRIKETKAGEEDQIEKLRQDKISVRNNPSEYGLDVDRKSSVKFWIGVILLIPLSLYIFIFYVSTSYSGFFRNFDPSVDLFGGMFYPQALQDAFKHGLLELGFIVFIPFVFFGLGYLIHMFQHKKGAINTMKIILLFTVTFLFDAILAYLIDSKLYDLNKTYGAPEFSIPYALQSPGFWVIIFAGFVSYIIWGLVFDFVMKEHADRDEVRLFISSKNAEIKNKENVIAKLDLKITDVQKEIDNLKERITELNSIIEGFIFPIKNYKTLSSQYLQGWQHFIASELAISSVNTESLLQKCRDTYDEHIRELELDNFSHQNRIFRAS